MINQDEILQKIENENSYLLSGIGGSGKTTLAQEIVKQCIEKSCPEYANLYPNNYPDYIYMKGGKVEDIHNLISKLSLKPYYTQYYVVLDNFNEVTFQGQNLLLKVLEESKVMFILVNNDDSRILKTINSRCCKITPKLLSKQQIYDVLIKDYSDVDISKGEPFSKEYIELVSELSNGSLGKGIKYLQNPIFKDFIYDLKNPKEKDFFLIASKYKDYTEERSEFFYLIEIITREKMYLGDNDVKSKCFDLILKMTNYKKQFINNANAQMIFQNIFMDFFKI